MNSEFLEQMRQASLGRVADAKEAVSLDDLMAKGSSRSTRQLPDDGFLMFAEVKPSSPSEGGFPDFDPSQLAGVYAEAGASAISVLTEPSTFGGSIELLTAVSSSVTVPVMRKDFLVDPYQVWEARAAGADGVLVIVRLLDDLLLQQMVEASRSADMFVLVEVFDEKDVARTGTLYKEAGVLLGVNSRDLQTLEVRADAHESLLASLPSGHRRIAESGLDDAESVRLMAQLGYDGVLVGSALMRSNSPGDLLRSMVMSGAQAT